MIAMSHWYSSSFFWTVAAAIITFAGVIITLLSLIVPWIFSRRTITYELRAAAPLIHMPVEVNPDLQVAYHGKPMKDPHIIVARLAYRGRRDLPSTAFDQNGPLRLDVGIEVTALLHSAFVPSREPIPKVRVNGKGVEIGPSLIRKKQVIEFVILADGPDVVLDCYGPLADVKIRPQRQEEARRRKLSTLRTISGWVCLAIVIWWVIEQPAAAAHLVHNIGAFFA
jgi:hypothetical protein